VSPYCGYAAPKGTKCLSPYCGYAALKVTEYLCLLNAVMLH